MKKKNTSVNPKLTTNHQRFTTDNKNAHYDAIGFVDGNYEDKYNATNPISKMLVGGFIENFTKLSKKFKNPQSIVEIGSGEGHLIQILVDMYPKAHVDGCDLSERVNDLAREKLKKYPQVKIQKENAENVSYKKSTVDAVVCCEVLEHVDHPEKALAEIYRILKNNGRAIVSVPHEPIWRLLNMARLKYLPELGNTPGHVNHWSRSSFKKFINSGGFTIVEDMSPFPWTMLLIQK